MSEWGGDLEIRLLAIALHRDIVVLTSGTDGSYARRFPCKVPPLPKMRGGVFIPIIPITYIIKYVYISSAMY